jgi:hypothetical protein
MTSHRPTARWLRRSVQAGLASLVASAGWAGFSAVAAVADANVAPTLTVVASSTTTNFSAVADIISYGFLVTNTGNATLDDIAINDTQSPPANQGNLSAISCPGDSLAPQGTETCTATYTVTQADLNHRSVGNSATAQGDAPDSSAPTVSDPSILTIPALITPVLTTRATSLPISLGETMSDTATITGISGSGVPTGSVAFFVCGPTLSVALCASTATPVTSATVPSGSDNGFVSTGTSGTFAPSQAGFYCFAAVFTPSAGGPYSGTTDNQRGTVESNECVDVVETGSVGGAPASTTTTSTTTTQVSGATVAVAAAGGDAITPAPVAQEVSTVPLAATGAWLTGEVTLAVLMLALGIAAVAVDRHRLRGATRHR